MIIKIITAILTTTVLWHISHKLWNKAIHALIGNGTTGKRLQLDGFPKTLATVCLKCMRLLESRAWIILGKFHEIH